MLGWLGKGELTVAGPGVPRLEAGSLEKSAGRSFHCCMFEAFEGGATEGVIPRGGGAKGCAG